MFFAIDDLSFINTVLILKMLFGVLKSVSHYFLSKDFFWQILKFP